MKLFLRPSILAAPAALLASLLASCVPNSGAKPAAAPRASSPLSHDINKLGQIITLPRRPLSAVWQQEQIGDGNMGPSDLRLTAVLRFAPADFKRIAQHPSIEAAPPQGEAEIEPWFPAALRQKAARNAVGSLTLRCDRLIPDAFFKNALIHGDLWQVEGTDYCVLKLFTA